MQFATHAFGDSYATTSVGPGTVALLTGDYSVSAADVSVATYLGSLSLGRTLTTLAPPAESATATGVFGPGWTADLTGPDAGDASLKVTDQTTAGYLTFTDTDGSVSAYAATTPVSTYPVSFNGIDDAADDGTVVKKASATSITMTDEDGTITTWTKTGSVWAVSGVVQTGSNTASTYSYDANNRVTRILGALPTGVTCTATPDTTAGCRSLKLTYTTLVVGGVSLPRLQSVTLSTPNAAGALAVEVAHYDYTTAGLLADSYDPRITPNLKTAYTYDTNNRLATLTPPGLAAYSFGYDTSGRLSTVSRLDPVNGWANTTVVYAVPFTGTGAPVELGATTTATWGQTSDLPAIGAAVFTADHVPAGTTPATVASVDWPYADLSYLDANGRTVNSAAYGAGAWQINTTRYDTNGNSIWTLTAGNRAQALTPTTDTDTEAAAAATTVVRANLLASTTAYDPLTPSQITDSYGPLHPVVLRDGTTVHARAHTATIYDEGAPDTTTYSLPTTIISSAQTTDGIEHDPETTRTGYAAFVAGDPTGWSLKQATSSTTQMGPAPSSADLTTITRYNTAGQTIQTRLPAANAAGTDAHTTNTAYYTATGTGACVSATLAGLTCTVGPAAQPATGNPLPVKTFTYDQYNKVLSTTETAGTTTRTTTATYDSGERPLTSTITVIPIAAGGTALPTVNTGYDTTTGLPTTTSTSTATLTKGYDSLGRQTSYIDAAGTTSSTGYDILGRKISINDGKSTTSWTYDSATEHRGVVTSENIGVAGALSVFTATYNPAGDLATQTYPNGLVASSAYDNAGNQTTLAYAKDSTNWMTFTAARDVGGKVRTQSGPASSQVYSYDYTERLTTVADTVNGTGSGSSCVTRTYTFDADSNRTALTSYPAGTGGVCSSTTTPATTSNTVDDADRITNTGYTYDTLGRTTTVPAADAISTGANSAAAGNLTVGYYANDMVNTQTQGTGTVTTTLDPNQNRVVTTSNAGTTTTNHYTGDDDSPDWTSTSASVWTRNLTGPGGDLAATADQTGAVTLQMANLHGDIIATCADITTATAVATYAESTEYGLPRSASAAFTDYGYLGTKQRSQNALGGLTLMGVRLYNPATGRFLSTDTVTGGNSNSYVYPADPINKVDLTGKFSVSPHRGHTNFYFNASDLRAILTGAVIAAAAYISHYLPKPILKAVNAALAWTVQHTVGRLIPNNLHLEWTVYYPLLSWKARWYRQ